MYSKINGTLFQLFAVIRKRIKKLQLIRILQMKIMNFGSGPGPGTDPFQIVPVHDEKIKKIPKFKFIVG